MDDDNTINNAGDDDNNNRSDIGGDKELEKDDNNKEEVAPDFKYYPDESTTCIFFDTSTNYYTLQWRYHPSHSDVRPSFPPSASICCSSHGLLLCRNYSAATSVVTYYVGNPFQEVPYLTILAPRFHPSNTGVVLSTGSDGTFLIICLAPYSTQAGNVRYTFQLYSSDDPRRWFTFADRIHLDKGKNRTILSKSGVSCYGWGYWLTWLPESRSSVSVLTVDLKGFVYPRKIRPLTYLNLPSSIRQNGGGIWIQLGRVGPHVGLVVADEKESTVKLYLIIEEIDDNYSIKMRRWKRFPSILNVEVDPTMEVGAVEVVGPNRIRCWVMPRPMRFESFKVEVLLSVGDLRVVVWEDSKDDFSTQVTVVDSVIEDNGVSFLARRAVPHVSSSIVPI